MRKEENDESYPTYEELIERDPELARLGHVDRKWLLVALGELVPGPDELREMTQHVATRGFDLRHTATRGKYRGMYANRAHYLKHAVKQKEWRSGTSLEAYESSLAEAVRGAEHIFTNLYDGREWQVAFVAPSGKYRGDSGASIIMVEYRIRNGYWVTGYQPGSDSLEVLMQKPERSHIRWTKRA